MASLHARGSVTKGVTEIRTLPSPVPTCGPTVVVDIISPVGGDGHTHPLHDDIGAFARWQIDGQSRGSDKGARQHKEDQ